jgi:hypothetical protein
MAQKKITELQLKSSVLGTESFPLDDTIQSYRVTASQLFDYIRSRIFPQSDEVTNLALATSVASSALTISLKTKANANPSSTDPIRIGFRSSTLTSGLYNIRSIEAATSLVISSGSTLGQASGQPSRLYVYLLDAGSPAGELAVSGKKFRDDELVTTTTEGGAGAADSRTVMYSTTARAGVPCKLIGYIDNTQTTAGTWASAGTQIQLMPANIKKPATVQIFTSGSGTYYTPAGCTRIRVRLVGGGGGAASSGTTTTGGGGNGASDTTFSDGATTLTGGGGGGGKNYATQGLATSGSASGGNVLNLIGENPGPVRINGIAATGHPGNRGGSNPLGIGGAGGENNSGGGGSSIIGYGGGGGTPGTATNPTNVGSPGASGGYVEHIENSPAAAWTYGIGTFGSAGGTGTSGAAGGPGKGGCIIVEEFYD